MVFSQSDYFAIWTDYNHSNLLKGKWLLTSDYGYRARLNYDYNWQRLHARSGIVYNTGKIKLLAGAAIFLVYLPFRVNDLEIRPWQGVKYQWPRFKKLKFNHFVRLEERIHFLESSNNSVYKYSEIRFRYSLMLKWNLGRSNDDFEKWVVFLGFEPFFNIYEHDVPISVAKSRTSVGLMYALTSKTKFRITYIYQPKSIPIFQNRDIYSNVIRLSVFQKFSN